MRAVIDCTSGAPYYCANIRQPQLDPYYDGPLMPLIDRPFAQHVIERCVSLGVTHADVIVDENEISYRAVLEDGWRWGCSINYHRSKAEPISSGNAFILESMPGETCLLANMFTLPAITENEMVSGAHVAFIETASGNWTGWALTDGAALKELTSNGFSVAAASLLQSRSKSVHIDSVVSCASPSTLLLAQQSVLEGRFHGLLLTGRVLKDGIRIGRNAAIHSTAQLTGPVYIGENTQIGASAKIGPNTVVARDCIIDRGNIIIGSLICTRTFVGEELEIRNSIVSGNRIINVEIGSSTEVTDPSLLGALPVS